MRSGSGIRILTTLACSIVFGTMPALAQQAGGMVVPGRDLKLGAWIAQPQVTQKGAVFQCIVERPLGPGGRKADRLALVIGGGAGWGIQIVRAAWSLDPDKDHDAVILVDGGRTVPVDSYALDPNRLAIHPSDVPTFEAYLKRGTTMAIRSRSAGIDEGGLPLDGIGAAIDWLDRCGRQFALHGAPPEGAVAKPLAPIGAPLLAVPAPPPPPAPLPTPAQGPIVVTPPPAAGPTTAAVPPPPAPAGNPPAPAAMPVPKPVRSATATTAAPVAAPEPTPAAVAARDPVPPVGTTSRQSGVTAPVAALPGSPAPGAMPTSPAVAPPATVPAPAVAAPRPLAVAPPVAVAEIRPLTLAPAKAVDMARASAPPSSGDESTGPKALLPTVSSPVEPAAEAIGKVVRGKTDRAAVLVRTRPSDDADPTGAAGREAAAAARSASGRAIEPVVVRGERGSIVTAVTRPAADPNAGPPTPSGEITVPSTSSATGASMPASGGGVSTPPATVNASPPATSGVDAVAPASPVPTGAASAPTGPVRVIQGVAAYPSPYAAAAPSGPTGAASDAGGRVPFDGPVPRAKPR